MTDAQTPFSWLSLKSGIPVVSSDGNELGHVHEVIADEQKDIFSGVTFKGGLLQSADFVPADLIAEMDAEAIRLTLSSKEAEERLEPYEP